MKSPYVQGLKQGFAEVSVYSVDFLLGLFQAIAMVSFEILLWLFILPVENQQALLDRTAYFLLTNGIALVIGGARYRFGRETINIIKDGRLSQYLLKPISPVLYIYSEHLGGRFSDLVVGLLFIGIGCIWIPALSVIKVLLLLFMLVTALINTYSLNVIVASIAFWTTEADGIKNVFLHITRLLNGQQIPLKLLMELLPKFLATWIWALPFASVAYTPALILLAKTSSELDLRFIVSSIVWAIILPILSTLLWKKGLRRYEGTGA